MSFLTVDFETYYAKDFTLSKLTTEEYIRDPRFEIIGVSVKQDDAPAEWFSGSLEELRTQLSKFDWAASVVLCHNTLFDGAILEWVVGLKPTFYYDTLCMARALHGINVGGSLAALVVRYGLGQKGTEVLDALGKRRVDFDPVSLDRYGAYCRNDVELTCKLFCAMAGQFPESEFNLIDMTLKMFIRPQLMVDDALLTQRLEEVQREKLELLQTLMSKLECDTEEDVRKKLCSNPKFAEVLRSAGVEPPMKISPTTGKETLALAKNDEGFIALQEHEDPFVQQLCAVRLGTKSTIEESRVERFIGIGMRNRGYLPVPLRYYGAHTGRWAGSDSVNFQNLPSRDEKKKALKNSVMAPRGKVVINCDSSQIEARVLAWLAGQDDVVSQFANGEDVYSIFASEVYKKPISKKNPTERFVGKTCILGLGYGTGAAKLRHTLATAQPVNVSLTEAECKDIVNIYRRLNRMIPKLWENCDRVLSNLIAGDFNPYHLDDRRVVTVNQEGIKLPNGLYIRYPNVRRFENRVIYDSRRGPVNIWGGAMVENIVQALARIIVGEQMLKVNERYETALTVHDAGVWVVPEGELQEALAFIVETMSTAPSWCSDLPVACEAHYGQRYGECK